MAGVDALSRKDRSNPAAAIPRWEWAMAVAGAVMLLGVVGYMTFHGLAYPEAPPQVVVEELGSVPSGDGYLVRFRARNLGNSTASALRISGVLIRGGRLVEESEALLDYLPQRSTRSGGLFFTADPARGELRLRAEGYAEP